MKYKQLTREQRYVIYLELKQGKSYSSIAAKINCSISTVSREIRRNTNEHGHYIWQQAHDMAQIRRERSTANRKTPSHILRQALDLLMKDWSPQQISGYLKTIGVNISHERIYQEIRADQTGELRKHTRHGMKYRRHIHCPKVGKGSKIPDRVSIHDRPEAADGKRFGDWELDLVVGQGQQSALVTLTERSTNYLLMAFIPNKKPSTVAKAVIRLLFPFRGLPLKTITTDNGLEFRDHKIISQKLRVPIYFADPYCSWQKGAIENANKLIRQYFPKGTDFRTVPEKEIYRIQKRINSRPRAKLNFLTPTHCFYGLCP